MGTVIHNDEIASIIKERIDNFEINPDRTEVTKNGNSLRDLKPRDFSPFINMLITNIREKKDTYFICPKCRHVSNTVYLFDTDENIVKDMLLKDNFICECCSSDNYYIQDKPTEDEMLIASFSRWNFITKLDHTIPELVVEDEVSPHGYKLGTINSLDDIDMDKINGNNFSDLKNQLDGIMNKLGMSTSKIPNKIKKMINQPNKTALVMELAEYKRRYKQSKKDNNKDNMEYYKVLMEETKTKIDITQD